MHNVTTRIADRKLIIEVDLDAPTVPSSTGKSDLLCSTGGAVEVPGVPGAKMGLSIYITKPKRAR